jgi:hypothetical protein
MLERTIRAIAGTITLSSLVLAHFFGSSWYWLTGFVGLNLLQSAFTRWCFMEDVLNKFMFRKRASQ